MSRGALQKALVDWCADPANAEAAYGHISTWDVSATTDLQYLVSMAPCVNTFNEDIDDWNVGQATTTAPASACPRPSPPPSLPTA